MPPRSHVDPPRPPPTPTCQDNVDSYDNVNGLTVAAQLSYNAALLDAAHGLGLSAGLKNALDLLSLKFADGRAVANTYDWFLNERCWEYNECNMYGESIKWWVSYLVRLTPSSDLETEPVYFLRRGRQNLQWSVFLPNYQQAQLTSVHALLYR